MSTVRLQEKKYLFVDNGNFRRYFDEVTEKWAGVKGQLNYQLLAKAYGAQKAFFYDCINDIRDPNETEEQYRKRLEEQEREFANISSEADTHVRLGSMTGTYKRRRQKEVDILLTVDMLKHAERRNMDTAILMSGDGDFRPLVEALVEMGLFAWVVADIKHTSRELRLAADRYVPLKLIDYYQWVTTDFREQYPLPYMIYGTQYMHNNGFRPIATGSVGEYGATLYKGGEGFGLLIELQRGNPLNVKIDNYDKLRLFCELNYGTMDFNI
jgi:uncharacterized LabA/DUF88 family protein